jgi:hypothetical protein
MHVASMTNHLVETVVKDDVLASVSRGEDEMHPFSPLSSS